MLFRSSCVILLLCDYHVKEVNIHTFKLKHSDNLKKESFDVEKSDGKQSKCHVTLCSHSSMMVFTGPMMYSYFDMCLLDNALEVW